MKYGLILTLVLLAGCNYSDDNTALSDMFICLDQGGGWIDGQCQFCDAFDEDNNCLVEKETEVKMCKIGAEC